jgi:hypothetical protein
VWVPPAPPNPGPKILAGLALGVVGLAVVRATMKHERKQMW